MKIFLGFQFITLLIEKRKALEALEKLEGGSWRESTGEKEKKTIVIPRA